MQSAEQLLSELDRLNIKLSVADGKLHCNAPKGAMTLALRDSICWLPICTYLMAGRPPFFSKIFRAYMPHSLQGPHHPYPR